MIPDPSALAKPVYLADATLNKRVTDGPQSYLGVASSTTDTTTTTALQVISSSQIDFTAVQDHLIKYTAVVNLYSTVAGDTIATRLVDASSVQQGTPSDFRFYCAGSGSGAVEAMTYVSYEVFTSTQAVTRQWGILRVSGSGTVHATGAGSSSRANMFLVEDCGLITPA